MDAILSQLQEYFTVDKSLLLLRTAFLVAAGFVVAKLLEGALGKLATGRLEVAQEMLLRRGVFYVTLGLFFAAALHQLGFNLGVLLGAAGILSVAIGFASQTSASNLVSGLFLIAERPFGVGDIIQVEGTTGQVLSIDLLAVKLRTFDNLYVRIPNETLIKSEVRTLTKLPLRRVDLQIGVAYKEDIDRVRDLLFELADQHPLCLDEPKPMFIMQRFGDSAVEFQFSCWALQPNFLELRTEMQLGIKRVFDEQGVEIPFPHRSLYTGTVTDPFPVRLVDAPSASDSTHETRDGD